MNFKLVLRVSGYVLLIAALSMLPSAAVAFLYGEPLSPFLMASLCTACAGFLFTRISAPSHFYAREGFFCVGLIWLLLGVVGALPFWFSGEFPSFVDCFFESCSGFTTTGATILSDIESISRGLLFWRSFTHWLGGMGVLVFATAVLPSLGIRSHYLTQAETPGPVFSKLVPKQSQTSKILYSIYFALTALEVLCLNLVGMPLYDSFIHAFSSAGTGGFSNRNASIAAYGSPAIEMVITVFILLFSVNFAVYFLLLNRKFKEALASDELHFFLIVVGVSTLLIAVNIMPIYSSVLESLRFAVFQVATIISTTGFATADFMLWPTFSQALLVMLMFCGACAGSTGGGMKCSRILLLARAIRREIHQIIHPNAVEVVKLDGRVVEERNVRSTLVFVGCHLMTLLIGALILSLDNCSFSVCFSGALTCLSNVGPGLDQIGPAGNFAFFSPLSKLVMSLLMIIGRLEFFPVLILFSRRAWSKM